MNRCYLLACASLLLFSLVARAQGVWQVTPLSDMIAPVSNNAVATEGDYVYSFMGIDTTKLYSGIHLKGFRYHIGNDTWDTIPSVPDNLTRIAASASTVKGKIYIIGGYHVYSNGNEVSSNKVFIYDPDSNSYTSGADIPVSTDDQVQCVWSDSLIYVISGWSNSANILDVQIYDPALDTWFVGSSLPAGQDYEAFGASGVIIGNTIYFSGGVTDTWVFSMIPKIRTGVINPANPTTINWSIATDSMAMLYRSGAGTLNGSPVWLGGADKAYNYDGIEYGSGAGVEPLPYSTGYAPVISNFSVDSFPGVSFMDLRGIAQVDSNSFIVAGGIGAGQQVSDKTYLLEYVMLPGMQEPVSGRTSLLITPNPSNGKIKIGVNALSGLNYWNIADLSGRIILTGPKFPIEGVDTSELQSGMYLLNISNKMGQQSGVFAIVD